MFPSPHKSVFLKLMQPCLHCSRALSSWSSQKVRSTFIDYFLSHNHEIVPSSSVIPKKGEGTYFTNAGMNQFKPIFLGECPPTNSLAHLSRAANSQKCIRVGGKHNDLEDVGHDLTHHTFFEMLGNWSFGDYFKAEACSLAYELLTERYRIPADRLYFTYFAGSAGGGGVPEDEECRDIWRSLGIPENRILPFGETDNFWDMGDTGPCGPCSEIHYDHVGSRFAPEEVNTGSPQLVEIWNLVFMQYNRLGDGSLQLLPSQHVDTGMGLERLTALLNGSADNYSTDLFMPAFEVIRQMSGAPAYSGQLSPRDAAYRTLADHARMITVAISDGLLPSNDNLGHKLRSILYRCIHICRGDFKVDPTKLLPALIDVTVDTLSCAYPDLASNKSKVCDVVLSGIDHHDRQRLAATKAFNKALSQLQGSLISGELMQGLEQGHYGSPVPVEVMTELALSRGLQLDYHGYSRSNKQKQAVQPAALRQQDPSDSLIRKMLSDGRPPTADNFKYDYFPMDESHYDFSVMEAIPSYVNGLSHQGQVTDTLHEGQQGDVILDCTCFYAESGGQGGDGGQLVSQTGTFVVTDTQNKQGFVLHSGHVTDGHISTSQSVKPAVFTERRQGCMRNHTATHLLNTALASYVPLSQQQGSSVSPYKLTFDFMALKPVPPESLDDIEASVQRDIKMELSVSRGSLPLEEALKLPDVTMLQNESYPDIVSVITIKGEGHRATSVELCGGTHVSNTAHLVDFSVTQLSTKSQNVKRITCVTGHEAQQALRCGKLLKMITAHLKELNLEEPALNWDPISDVATQLISLMKSRQERLRHSVTCTPECDEAHASVLGVMLSELEKSIAWAESVLHLGTHQDEVTAATLRSIVAILRKGKDLELVQKSARIAAETCLHRMEHKITEAINQKMLADLQKRIETAAQERRDDKVMGFFLPSDFPPRQMVKVFRGDGGVWDSCEEITLVHFSKKVVTVVHGMAEENASEEKFAEMLKALNALAPSKGRQTLSSDGKVRVSTFHVDKRDRNGQLLDRDLIKAHLALQWRDAEES